GVILERAPNQKTKKCAATSFTPISIRAEATVTATTIYKAVDGRPILNTIQVTITNNKATNKWPFEMLKILVAIASPIPVIDTTAIIIPTDAQAMVTCTDPLAPSWSAFNIFLGVTRVAGSRVSQLAIMTLRIPMNPENNGVNPANNKPITINKGRSNKPRSFKTLKTCGIDSLLIPSNPCFLDSI